MAEDDPLGKRAFLKNQKPMEQLEDMMRNMPDMIKQMRGTTIRIQLDLTPDEGIQILGLLKDMRK